MNPQTLSTRRDALESCAALLQCVRPFLAAVKPRLSGDEQIVAQTLHDFATMASRKLIHEFPELLEILTLWERPA